MNWFMGRFRSSNIWPWGKTDFAWFSRFAWGILVILASAFILYKTVKEWHQLQNALWRLDPRCLVISFGVYSVSVMLTASCWALIMGHFSGVRTFWRHVITFCLTNLAQRLPTPLPYISARTEAYHAYGISRKTTLTAMAMEITVTLFSATIVALATLIFGAPLYAKAINYILYVLLLSLVFPVLFPQKSLSLVNLVLARLNCSPLPTALSGRQTLGWIGIFIVIWLNSGVLYYFLISSISSAPEGLLLFLVNISAVSGIAGWFGQALFFVPTPAVRQLTMVYLLSLRFPMPLAVVFALFFRVAVMVFELVWAGLCLLVSAINKHSTAIKANQEGGHEVQM